MFKETKWQQRDSNSQPFSSKTNTQSFSQTHVRVSDESTLYNLPECQGTPCLKQGPYLELKDSNGIQTHNHLTHKRTLSVYLQTKWFWVRILLLSLKLQIWRLLRARRSLTFKQVIECGFTLKLVRDMIITYS